MTCGPECVVCDRAGHLPEPALECLHRHAGKWKHTTFGNWAGYIVSIMGACWSDGYIVGRAEGQSPQLCSECGVYPADLPSSLCVGCAAYMGHQA